MTTPFISPLDAMAGLLDERNRYEGWLAQLETHGKKTPTHVLERVRVDYAERLQGVLDQLRSRASELEISASQMEKRIAALQAEEDARSDERAEGELRAAVGEFSPEYARELLARCDEAIGRLSAERGAISGELARVQEILELVRRPTPPAARAATPPKPARVSTPAPRPAAQTPPQRTVPPSPPAQAAVPAEPLLATNEAGSFDELAFLQSVVEPRVTESSPPPVADMVVPPLAGARRAASTPTEQAPQSAQSAQAARTMVSTPDDMPAFLKDAPTEQAKTLKCQECGTMNYATEWYCERCGGELAAM